MSSKITQLILDAREIIYNERQSETVQAMFNDVFVDYLMTAYRDLRQVRSVQDILNRNYINVFCHLLTLASEKSAPYTRKKIQHVIE